MGMSTSAMAVDFDGSKSLICASQTANECVMGKHCNHVAPASINIPDFFNVDVKGKVISGPAAKTPIERVEHLDGKLVLQGADDGVEGVRDGLGWTMTIDEETGKMTLGALGDGFAIVVFGACTVR
jgi:hypothetical protein